MDLGIFGLDKKKQGVGNGELKGKNGGWEAVWVEKRVSPLRSSQKRAAPVEMTVLGGGRERHSGRRAPLENAGILRCAQNDDVKLTTATADSLQGLEAAEAEVVLDDEGEPEDGGGEEEGVDAVEDSS